MSRLQNDEIEAVLRELSGWRRVDEALVREVTRRSWRDAIAFLAEIADEAERRDHHPDLCVTGYRTVTIRLTSHDAGGITGRDVRLARWIEDRVAGRTAGDGSARPGPP